MSHIFCKHCFFLRNKIWAAAVLKDQWIDKNLNAPLEILSNMMFFKLMELVVVTGEDQIFKCKLSKICLSQTTY